MLEIVLIQVQDLALVLIELLVWTGPSLSLIKVPLDDIPSFHHVDCPSQIGVTVKAAEGKLNPTIQVSKEDVQYYRSHCDS